MKRVPGLRKTSVLWFVGASLVALVFSAPLRAQTSICGDSDGDSVLKIQDFILDLEYIFRGGAPPASFDAADFDGHQLLTIADPYELLNCFFTCDFGVSVGICPPTQPALAPVVDPAIELRYQSLALPGVTSFDLPLTLVGAPSYGAFTAPLLIYVNGAPAIIDSVTVPAPGSVFASDIGLYSIDGPGVVRLGALAAFNRSSSLDVPAIIHLSIPFSTAESSIEVNWTTLSPAQAPTADSSVYPLFYSSLGDPGFVPTLTGLCCLAPGDADYDGSFNIADVTFLIRRIFLGGNAPPCPQSADSDGDGDVTVADVTFDITNIFTSGLDPICGP